MAGKRRDERNRWRNKTVAFRVSPEEDALLESFVRLSGQTKQDNNARREQLGRVLEELRRIESGAGVDADLLAVIRMIAQILDGMRDSAAP